MEEKSTLKDKAVDDIRQIKAERDSLQKELEATRKKLHEVEGAHAALKTSHTELEQKLGPQKRAYQYREDECRPVHPHGKCEVCGWDYDTQTKPGMQGRQPHPV